MWKNQVKKALQEITVSIRNADIREALETALSGLPFTYEVHGKVIYIKRKHNNSTSAVNSAAEVSATFQQQIIHGRVTDTSGTPITSVSVLIKGTKKGTLTDQAGRYQIGAENGQVLQFSFIGYKLIERTINGESDVNVTMQPEISSLDELVVVGYGTQKRNNVTSAISTIKAADIPTTTSSSLAQSLTGKIPGLQIRQQNSEAGAFSSTINIRGFGEPLYVIDGIVRNGGVELDGFASYRRSKVALIMYSMDLANRIKDTGIVVNSLHQHL